MSLWFKKILEAKINKFHTGIMNGQLTSEEQFKSTYSDILHSIYDFSSKNQTNTKFYENVLNKLKQEKDYFDKNIRKKNDTVLNSENDPVLDLEQKYFSLKRRLHTFFLENKAPKKLIADISCFVNVCEQVQATTQRKEELKNMFFSLLQEAKKNQEIYDNRLIRKIYIDIKNFNDMLNNPKDCYKLSFDNFKEDFDKICERIKQISSPTEEMTNFLQLDINRIEKQIKEKSIINYINTNIRIFYKMLNSLEETYLYKEKFNDICERIKQISSPTEEMTNFLCLNVDKIESIKDRIVKCYEYDIKKVAKTYEQIYTEIKQNKLQDTFQTIFNNLTNRFILMIQNWFEQHVTYKKEPYIIDKEQASVIADVHKNLLVRALAGSGKTRTLVAKIVFWVGICDISDTEIMAFVFNKTASDEINDRLKEIKVDDKQIIINPIASTFHSFAYNNTNHNKILSDSDRTKFIQNIINSNISKDRIYNFFKKEATTINKRIFSNQEDYFFILRNSTYETLDNKKVKSSAEKIICDFLFEHGINYTYEQNIYINNLLPITKESYNDFFLGNSGKYIDCIKPDFVLNDYNIVWEHWAITGSEEQSEIDSINKCGVIGSYEKYKETMEWKKNFYKREWIDDSKTANKYGQRVKDWNKFIETYRKPNESREDFENQIECILKKYGISLTKRPKEELIKEVWEKRINKFTSLIVQFIDRAEQTYLSDLQTLDWKMNRIPENTRERDFLDIALEVYKIYMDKLSKNSDYDMDFSILMDKVAKGMPSNSNLCNLINSKKYILIDEFQDFSKLFFNFVQSMQKINPHLKIMCVGDEYQAINRFAGSDVDYFINFKNYFPEGSDILEILTNYRCGKEIVENAKIFLQQKLGVNTAFKAHKTESGEIIYVQVDNVFIENRKDKDDDYIYKKEMLISENRTIDKLAVQYLKTITQIIKDNKDKKSIKILHRNNDTSFWFDLKVLYQKIQRTCAELNILNEQDFKEKVSIDTMHRSKGREAEVVILIEIDDSIIPGFNSNSCLFEIFGETPQILLQDQKRLFYVALTRAEQKLYILYNSKKGSDFLNITNQNKTKKIMQIRADNTIKYV